MLETALKGCSISEAASPLPQHSPAVAAFAAAASKLLQPGCFAAKHKLQDLRLVSERQLEEMCLACTKVVFRWVCYNCVWRDAGGLQDPQSGWVATCMGRHLHGPPPAWVATCMGRHLHGSPPAWVATCIRRSPHLHAAHHLSTASGQPLCSNCHS